MKEVLKIFGALVFILLFCGIDAIFTSYWWFYVILIVIGSLLILIAIKIDVPKEDDKEITKDQKPLSWYEELQADNIYIYSDGDYLYLFDHEPTDFDKTYAEVKRAEKEKQKKNEVKK